MFKDFNKFKKYLENLSKESAYLRKFTNLRELALTVNKGLEVPFPEELLDKAILDIINDSYPVYCDKKGNIITYRLAEYMISNEPMFTNGFNIYAYKDGVYKAIEERFIYKKIYSLMLLDTNKTTAKAKEVVESIKTITYTNEVNNHCKQYVNVKNGVINLDTRKLEKHNPKFKTTLQFQANYMNDKEFNKAFENSTFNKFLNTTLSNANIITLQECFGLILSPHAKEVQKAFIFLGNGSNGKSAVAEIITKLVGGNSFMSCLGLSDFEKKFDLANIEGKFLNMNIDDESVSLEKTGKFKSIIAGDAVDIEKKGKDKVSYIPNLTCIIGLNKLPSTGDRSHGFYRRQYIIPFNQTFGTKEEVANGTATQVKNPKMIQYIIKNEMDIVFTWALKGLYRLIENEFVLTYNDEVAAELEEFRLESDSVYAFYKFKIELSPFDTDRIKASVLYQEYENYCRELGVPPQNGTNFGKGLKALGVKAKRTNAGNYYLGIIGFKDSCEWNNK